MDVFINPGTWKHLSEAFVSLPYHIMLPLVAASIWVGWWLRGIKSEGAITSLKAGNDVYESRLKFAAEQNAELERQFKIYKEEVAANAEKGVLAATAAKVDAAIEKVRSAIGVTVGVSTAVSVGTTVIRADKDSHNDDPQ